MKQRIWTELPMFSQVTVKRIRIMTVQTGTTKKKRTKGMKHKEGWQERL